MDAKSLGVMSFALAVSPALGAQAAPARAPAVPVAKSYSELLEPIPNASERLKQADLQDRYAPARLIRAQWDEGREHHHHHHHHHHNNYGYVYGAAPYYSPYSDYYPSYYASPYSPYSAQPYGYTTYYGGAYYRGHVRRPRHHHHHHHHHDRD